MKKILILFRQSVQALFSNKGRSFLTMLGIIIGIGSVIALMSLGEGTNRTISKQIDELGANTLMIIPGGGFEAGGNAFSSENANSGQYDPGAVSSLTTVDLQSLQDKSAHPYVAAAGGLLSSPSIIRSGTFEKRAAVYGTSSRYFEAANLSIASGRGLGEDLQTSQARTIVLGSEMAQDIFEGSNPVGRRIFVNQNEFEVVGVLAKKPKNQFDNPNIYSFIPLTAASALGNSKNLSAILVRLTDEERLDEARENIKQVLMENHGIINPKLVDFSVVSPEDLLGFVTQITGILTGLLSGIAGISLVVGGIGIMNIMLVTVTERTREIGLRKAVGAKTSDIVIQFLMEALILTLLGGIFGIILGWGIGEIFSKFVDLEPVITGKALLLAIGVSSAVGLIFGLYPAFKAARLNPIDALRYE